MNKIVIGIPLAVILPALAYAGTFYLDSVYVRQDTYKQSVQQSRIWDLTDRINGLKDKAAIEGRSLTPAEKRQIDRWSSEIRKLGGNI